VIRFKKISVSILILIIIAASFIGSIQLVKASVENITTSALVNIQPEKLEINQNINITVQIYPPPPAPEIFQNITATLYSAGNPANGYVTNKIAFMTSTSDINGYTSFSFNVTVSGTIIIDLYFPGQYFANNTLFYQAGNWQDNIYVTSPPNPSPSPESTVNTFASIMIEPAVPKEGQPFRVEVQMSPCPPPDEIFNDLFLMVTSPRQGIHGFGPWSKGNISTNTDGKATVIFDIPTFSGYWIIDLSFGGQYFANNTIYYNSGNWHKNFYISSSKTPDPPPITSPSPTTSASPTPTPTPTISSITQTPTPTPPQNGNQTNLEPMDLLFPISVFLAVSIGLSVLYYSRHRKTANLSKKTFSSDVVL